MEEALFGVAHPAEPVRMQREQTVEGGRGIHRIPNSDLLSPEGRLVQLGQERLKHRMKIAARERIDRKKLMKPRCFHLKPSAAFQKQLDRARQICEAGF